MKTKLKRTFESVYLYLIFIFLYVPIAVLIAFSFNESKSRGVWGGFSLKWYEQMLSDMQLLAALRNTLIVGVLSAVISCAIGTAAAIGIQGFRSKRVRNIISEITNIPMVSSELVIGVSLMILFIAAGVLLAHITFNIPYVILSVTPKLMTLDPNLYEAAIDLGARPWYAFRHVVMPEIMPGVVNGLLLAFTLSIDDFVISFFTTGNGVSNLSIYVYSTAKRLNPKINALCAVMFVVIMAMLFVISKRTSKDKDDNVLIK